MDKIAPIQQNRLCLLAGGFDHEIGAITAKGGCCPVNQRLLVASHLKVDDFGAQFARFGSGTLGERLLL
jgi:hypothetical protein